MAVSSTPVFAKPPASAPWARFQLKRVDADVLQVEFKTDWDNDPAVRQSRRVFFDSMVQVMKKLPAQFNTVQGRKYWLVKGGMATTQELLAGLVQLGFGPFGPEVLQSLGVPQAVPQGEPFVESRVLEPAPDAATGGRIRPGILVRISGVQSHPGLNGRLAMVTRSHMEPSQGEMRWILDVDGEEWALREEKLTVEEAGPHQSFSPYRAQSQEAMWADDVDAADEDLRLALRMSLQAAAPPQAATPPAATPPAETPPAAAGNPEFTPALTSVLINDSTSDEQAPASSAAHGLASQTAVTVEVQTSSAAATLGHRPAAEEDLQLVHFEGPHGESLGNSQPSRKRGPSLEASRDCNICLDSQINTVFVPCGHSSCCYQCAQRFYKKPCPICRKKVKIVQRLFLT